MSHEVSRTELCDRYAQLYTGAITDVLDDFGYEDQTIDNRINGLTMDMAMAGVAYPIVGRPNRGIDPDENIRNILEMLGDAPEDAVLAYETNDREAAHLGELSVSALKHNGCRGAVIDGGVRDVAHILERDFPVFTRHRTPADAVPRWEILDWGVEATVGDVRVTPGDIVMGDVDGVVVVPEEVAVEVLEEAEALKDTEDAVREAVEDGVDPLTAYEEHGEF